MDNLKQSDSKHNLKACLYNAIGLTTRNFEQYELV